MATDKPKPTFGAVPDDPNPIGKNAYRPDFHAGRRSAAKTFGAGYGSPIRISASPT